MVADPPWTAQPHEALRVGPGFDLAALDTRSTPGWDGAKDDAVARMAEQGGVLSVLQEMLFAHGRTGGDRSLLLVLQGMDTSGKGGIVRHVVGMVDPQGVDVRAFGVPTDAERSHHYLWRIRQALPRPGRLGVFDRSHYEDVLVVRVREIVPPEVLEPRYAEINAFEGTLVAAGTTVVKVLLAISPDEQARRLRDRLDRPEKHWKYDPSDLDARERWSLYQEAYQSVLDRTSTVSVPWYAVPADRKWFARLAVTELLVTALDSLGLDWPEVDLDVATELRRLEASGP